MPALRPDPRRWVARVALVLWPAVVGAWFARGWLLLPPDAVPANHEEHAYVYRLIEFRDLLAAGYWSPQWATDFRKGLGSPYFVYYQPGFFYLASLVPWSVEPTRALGWTVIAAIVFGFATAFAFIRSRFGPWAGVIGATAFVVAPYVRTDLIVRGDLSELTGMMLVPFVLHRFLDALEDGRRGDLVGIAIGVAAAIVVHPAVGLLLGLALGASLAVLGALRRAWARAALVGAAMAVGVGLAGFYVLPVALETHLVSFDAGFVGLWDYRRHLVGVLQLLLDPTVQRPFPVSPGRLSLLLVLCNVVLWATGRRTWTPAQRRFFGFTLLVTGLMLFLMTPASRIVWEHLAVLQKVQFPGRALAVLTPAMACVIGAIGGTTRWDRRHAALGLLTLALAAWSLAHAPLPRARRFVPVASAADIATGYFRPDLADEWLPRGATNVRRHLARQPSVWGSGCALADFRREQGLLAVRVQGGPTGCIVTMPHFFFPVGWRATLDGSEGAATLGRTPNGLMQVRVAPGHGGALEVVFGMTPMRRLGWGVTALAATVGLGVLALLGRRRG
jgi:uncharacterized membrane protein